jgi:transcriptional regulator with XRE-family HTH domain/DNA-directed RNA polymerase subunit RPC12/RpoP
MDQIKIGKFISSCRRKQGMTQAVLAEKLGITDRAVSKWETGKNLPDASIMPELCRLLGINITELFIGERLVMDDHKKEFDELLVEMKKQEETANKRLLHLEVVFEAMVLFVTVAMTFLGSIAAKTNSLISIIHFILIVLVLVPSAIVGLKIEHDAGYYECPECKERYVPTMKAVVMAPHFGTTRKMKCPYCGSRAYHKKVLIK